MLADGVGRKDVIAVLAVVGRDAKLLEEDFCVGTVGCSLVCLVVVVLVEGVGISAVCFVAVGRDVVMLAEDCVGEWAFELLEASLLLLVVVVAEEDNVGI